MKKRTYTNKAFISLIIPVIYIAVFFFIELLATLTEFPTGRSGIYLVFASIGTFLMMFFPVAQIGCSISSIWNQIKALSNSESKKKNLAMMIIAIIYIAAAIFYSYQLWLGIMSA